MCDAFQNRSHLVEAGATLRALEGARRRDKQSGEMKKKKKKKTKKTTKKKKQKKQKKERETERRASEGTKERARYR